MSIFSTVDPAAKRQSMKSQPKASTTRYSHVSTFTRHNLDESLSDIQVFVTEFRDRCMEQLDNEMANVQAPFQSFDEKYVTFPKETWVRSNNEKFFLNTPNDFVASDGYLSEMGYMTSAIYAPSGEYLIVGHSTGLIQRTIEDYFNPSQTGKQWYPIFSEKKFTPPDYKWVEENQKKFLDGTPNKYMYHRWYHFDAEYITSLAYSPDGERIIVGHSTGLIQMRHGHTGIVLTTLRSIQFPPRPIYALEYSRNEENVCYAACTDGVVYRVDIPTIETGPETPKQCIKANPNLEWLNTQFYGSATKSMASTPFISGQRSPALSLGMTADSARMVVGFGDSSVKIYNMETQETESTFKVHKLRLAFIPKKLQRVHCGEVVALKCHNERPFMFATGGWDNTLRIWDIRCKVGCMMTFEGVNVCHDSIDLNREHCVVGSWQPTEALTVWDLVARKRLSIVRVQNRRPDVDGEYIYACRYWRSSQFNRKGKYAIVGGSGTGSVEVINLHNRYISCSYPAPGTVLAIASYDDRIAFGGTASVFSIVSFHDPKHEKYDANIEPEYDFREHDVTLLEIFPETEGEPRKPPRITDISKPPSDIAKKMKGSTSGETRTYSTARKSITPRKSLA